MNTTYAISGPNGEIARLITMSDTFDPADQCDSGEAAYPVVDGVRDDTHYINTTTGKANKRPATPCTPDKTEVTADGQDELKLSGLLADTEVTIRGPVSDTLTAEDTLELTFSVPGEYQITALASFPHKPTEVTINAS